MGNKSSKQKRKTLREEVESLKTEVALMHSIVETIWSELELETVLGKIIEFIKNYTGADSCLLYLYKPKNKTLELSASSSSTESIKKVNLKLGEGITGWVAANRKLVAIEEKSYEDKRFKFVPNLEEDTYESFLSVPLVFKGKLIGVLNVQRKEPHKYSHNEIRLIEFIAQQVAGAIENARLYSELKEKAQRLEALYEVSKNLANESYLDDFLAAVLSVTSQVVGSRLCVLFLYDSEKEKLSLASVQPSSKEIEVLLKGTLNSRLLQGVFLEKKPKQVFNLDEVNDESLKKLVKEMDLRSLLAVPVVDRKNCLGVLQVYTSYTHAFSVEEVRLVQAFANQIAVAVRASENEDRAIKLERKLHERRVVDKAKAVLIKQFGFTEEKAYEFLRKKSMDLRKTIGEVAESILTLEELKNVDLSK